MNKKGQARLSVFGTPLIFRGWRSLPFIELVAWLGLAWFAGRRRAERTTLQRLGVGLLTVPALLMWEWLHNIAHAVAARWAGKSMDSLEVIAGMPICVYSIENHRSATPRQHIVRALGGPVFNLAAMAATRLARHFTPRGSLSREVLDVAVNMNTFLATVSLLPLPGIDGGPVLKWSLVSRGQTQSQADSVVRRVDLAISPALGGLAWAFFRRGRWIWGGFMAFFAFVALAVGMGWMKGETREI